MKAGRSIAAHMQPTAKERAEYAEAQRWYEWLATLVVDWPCDTTPVEVDSPAATPSQPADKVTGEAFAGES